MEYILADVGLDGDKDGIFRKTSDQARQEHQVLQQPQSKTMNENDRSDFPIFRLPIIGYKDKVSEKKSQKRTSKYIRTNITRSPDEHQIELWI